jgi:hypothetical protein
MHEAVLDRSQLILTIWVVFFKLKDLKQRLIAKGV